MRVRTVELSAAYAEGALTVVRGCLAPSAAREWRAAVPPLSIVAVDDDDRVLGVGFGVDAAGDVHLQGIAVAAEHRRLGLGSHLLGAFERAARGVGGRVVSLGTDGGAVDRFYEANGYEHVEHMVRLSSPVDAVTAGLQVRRVREVAGGVVVNVAVDGLDADVLRHRLAAAWVGAVFAKQL